MMNPAELLDDAGIPDVPAPIPGVLVTGHDYNQDDYRIRRSRGAGDWLLTFTLGGQGMYRLHGQDHACHAGDVAILLPGVPHDYRTVRGKYWDFLWAHFIPRPQWLGWLQLGRNARGLVLLPIDDAALRERLHQAFLRLLRDSKQDKPYSDELAQNALEEVLLLITQSGAQGSARFDPRIEHTLSYLTAHLGDAISVETLAAGVAMSPSGFAHLFKAQVGVSPMQMLLKLRLKQAARLLEYTARSVQEIAFDLGFESPFHFSRQFKAWHGLSPKHYRQSKWG